MKQRVRKYMEEHGMIRPGDTLVAGVSGGADSLCLFLLLHDLAPEMGFRLHVVHVHHGLRLTAQDDLEFVRNLCAKMDVPCTIVRADAAASAKEWGTGVEEAGRRLRYQAFRRTGEQLAEQNACRPEREEGQTGQGMDDGSGSFRIAVAHHREDQAETVLFHLCRGTDLRGARGMLPVNGQIIRPLLRESRASIENYLTERGFTWQEDETNTDTGYTRNYIRREIMPRLEEGVHAAAAQRIARFAEACAEAEDCLAGLTDRALGRCSAAHTDMERMLLADSHVCTKVLSLDALRREDPYLQGRILYRCLTDSTLTGQDMGAVHVEALRGLCAGERDGQLSMPSRVTVIRSGGRLFFCREGDTAGRSLQAHPAEQEITEKIYPVSQEEYECCLRDFDGSMSSIPKNEYTKWFDYDKIGTFPVFRTRQPGDYMCLYSVGKIQPGGGAAEETPGGCSNPAASPGNREMICKKLARIMLDAKIPAGIRDRVVLPFAGHEALWIPGLRMGDSCKVTSSTTRILEIHWNVRRERWHTVSKK